MAVNYKDWQTALSTFMESAEKELQDIRQSKAELQRMKREMVDMFTRGQYIRDDARLVISAPEIIIGNVDKDGTLKTGEPSRVIIRANNISEEGVGAYGLSGYIVHKASQIRNVCADPGIDGREEVVSALSSFTVQAQGIALRSEDTEGTFASAPAAGAGGISLRADSNVNIEAAVPCEQLAKSIEASVKEKKAAAAELKSAVAEKKKSADALIGKLEETLNANPEYYDTDEHVRTNYIDLYEMHTAIESLSNTLNASLNDCVASLSALAELNRQVKCLEAKKKKIDGYKSDYKTKSTGAYVSIRAEHTSVLSVDGDSNLRDNAGAGFSVQGHDIRMQAGDGKGGTMADSTFTLAVQDISLNTSSPKVDKETADIPAAGSVRIVSKDIRMDAVDYEYKDKKISEKALTQEGSIALRAETVTVGSNDTEGKAAGSFSVNSKAITLKAVDVDKESRADQALAKDSTMLLLSDKMYLGSKNKDNQSSALQVSSDKVGVFAKTTAEIQQNDGKAALQLDGGNIAIGGSKASVYGETEIGGKATFKGDVTMPKATIDNLEAKTSFKSPHISDGIAIPGAPSSASLSTKLKEEEVKEAEKK